MTESAVHQTKKQSHLIFEVEADCLPEFFGLLQGGFSLATTHCGRSVRTFLKNELGLTDDYISQRISTLFLDGMPVDDIDTAVVQNGSRLALSSAMPGLVGATMRQGSPLAALRDTISYKTAETREGGNGQICLKLFNLIMSDIGPHILGRGIIVRPESLKEFLKRHGDMVNRCSQIQLNGSACSPEALQHALSSAEAETICLTVCAEKRC